MDKQTKAILILLLILIIVGAVFVLKVTGVIEKKDNTNIPQLGDVSVTEEIKNQASESLSKQQIAANMDAIKLAVTMEDIDMKNSGRTTRNVENIKETIEQNGNDNVKVKSLGNNELEVTIDGIVFKVDKDGKVYNPTN